MGKLSNFAASIRTKDADFQSNVFRRLAVKDLKQGATLEYPVFDEHKRELLAAGTPISDTFLEQLKQQDIQRVLVEQTDIIRLDKYQSTSCPPPDNDGQPAICKCGQLLPLKMPPPGGPAVTWACTKCGATYRTTINPVCYSELSDRVRPIVINISRSQLRHPSEEIAEFVSRLVQQPYGGPERRSSRRYPLCMPVPVLPVDEEFRPAGDPYVLMSRNVSMGGIAMIHSERFDRKFLILELAPRYGSPIQMVLEVLRCSAVGDFYEIAGKFLTRIDD